MGLYRASFQEHLQFLYCYILLGVLDCRGKVILRSDVFSLLLRGY